MLAPAAIGGEIDSGPIQAWLDFLNSEKVGKSWAPFVLVEDYGAVGDGVTDDAGPIQAAVNAVASTGGGKVVIKNGAYAIGSPILLDSHVHIQMSKGTTLIKTFNGSIFETKNNGKGAYDNVQNIKISGGILDNNAFTVGGLNGGITINHVFGFHMTDVSILDVSSGHAIEINSSSNCLIENNKFLGYLNSDGTRDESGAIQLDSALPGSDDKTDNIYDGTPSRNIIVTDNYFGVSGTPGISPYPRAIGMHKSSNGKPYENIIFVNNIVENTTNYSVSLMNVNHVLVKDNIFGDAGGLCILQPNISGNSGKIYDPGTKTYTAAASFPANHHITVSGNKLTGVLQTPRFIYFDSETTGGAGGFEFVEVSENECHSPCSSYGIHLNNVAYKTAENSFFRTFKIEGNKVGQTGDVGIRANNVVDGIVSKNILKDSGGNGINVHGPYTKDVLVSDNHILNPQNHGLYTGDGADGLNIVNNFIKGANVSQVFGSGIRCAGGGNKYFILGNMIQNGDTEMELSVSVDSVNNTNVKFDPSNNYLENGSVGAYDVGDGPVAA